MAQKNTLAWADPCYRFPYHFTMQFILPCHKFMKRLQFTQTQNPGLVTAQLQTNTVNADCEIPSLVMHSQDVEIVQPKRY